MSNCAARHKFPFSCQNRPAPLMSDSQLSCQKSRPHVLAPFAMCVSVPLGQHACRTQTEREPLVGADRGVLLFAAAHKRTHARLPWLRAHVRLVWPLASASTHAQWFAGRPSRFYLELSLLLALGNEEKLKVVRLRPSPAVRPLGTGPLLVGSRWS